MEVHPVHAVGVYVGHGHVGEDVVLEGWRRVDVGVLRAGGAAGGGGWYWEVGFGRASGGYGVLLLLLLALGVEVHGEVRFRGIVWWGEVEGWSWGWVHGPWW